MNRTGAKTFAAVGCALAVACAWFASQTAFAQVDTTIPALAGEYTRFATPAPQTADGQTATLLPDGRWLFVGGRQDGAVSGVVFTRDFRPGNRQSTQPALNASLLVPRFGHSTTVLPDGTLLIFGGRNSGGTIVSSAEVFDPATGATTMIEESGMRGRTHHTATLLTDGRVLVAGGEAADAAATNDAQLWNFDTLSAEPVPGGLRDPRAEHSAALLSSGQGLIWGGRGDGQASSGAELFDPLKRIFNRVDPLDSAALPPPYLRDAPPAIQETIPASNAAGVDPSTRVAVRLSRPIAADEIDASRMTVVGPSGAIGGKIVAAADGLLLFFTPDADLLPGETYTVFLRTQSADPNRAMPWSTFSFTTEILAAPGQSVAGTGRGGVLNSETTGPRPISDAPSSPVESKPGSQDKKPPKPLTKREEKRAEVTGDEFEDWIPSARHRRGKWRVLGMEDEPRAIGALERAAALEAPEGVTALSGRVARLNGRPIANASVSIGGVSTRTDRVGRFLISNLPAGTHELSVDGGALHSGGRRYASHFIRVDVADKKTTVVPDPIFLARLNPANDVTFASPTDREVVLTHAKIPGLEIHIPKGAVLRTRDGQIVTRLNISPLPVDRVPFALPTNFPVYFTIQPAGVFVDSSATGTTEGIRVIYPNYLELPPKKRVAFWNYDPAGLGWQVYGHGRVSADGKQVIPDAGVAQSNLMAFGYGLENVGNGTEDSPAPGNCGSGECKQPAPSTCGGDPVDCATGLFIHRVTDLAVDDTIPVVVSRTYRQNDDISRDFGIGTSHDYGWFLSNPTGNPMVLPDEVDLILAAGSRVRFKKIAGSTAANIVYQHTSSPTRFMNATLRVNTLNDAWEMTLRDKSVFAFEDHSPNALTGIRDRYGNKLTIARSGGKITKITSPHGRFINFEHDALDRITFATDNLGRRVRYEYDAAGRLWRVTDPTGHVEEYGYNTDDRMTTVTDKRGNTMVTNVYDANGRVQQQTLADGAIWQFAYTLNGLGKVSGTTITDPRGYDSQLTFNAAQYLTQTVHAVGEPEQQTYTYAREAGTNLVTSITDPLGRVTRFGYDFFANVTSVTRLYGTADAVTESSTYESTFGNLTSYTDPLNHQVTLNYDSLGNLRKITDALSHSATATYDAAGKLSTVTSPLNQVTQLNYDLGDIAGVTDALGRTASVFTDNVGRVTGAVDPQGNRGRVEYDAMNRVLRSTDALGLVTQMTYDGNGNLRTVRDARDLAVHEYTYDPLNRTKTYVDPLGNVETYNYDANGNVESRIDRKNQTTVFTYDPLNRLKTITFADSSTITLTWDAGNRLRTIADSDNGTLSHDYDGLDRLTRETGPQGQVDYVYDDAGRRTEMTVSGLPTVNYEYDAANRLTEVSRGSHVIGFSYDAANRRTSTTLPNGIVTTYDYDDGDQLLSINYDQGPTHIGELTYSYDSSGRRTGMGGSLAKLLMPTTVTSTSYNAANQLTLWGATAITYDDNGNMLTAGAASYTWNARDELTGTSEGSGSFAYDAAGRRRARTVTSTPTNYLHDGSNPVTVDGEEWLAGMGMDEIYTRIGASGTLTRLTDALGSTVALADGSGNVTANYSYGAYGQVSKTGSADTSFQYTGRENDGGSNLYYYRARYYSPQFNRFISEDPIGLSGGINTFAYVGGDPISMIDPEGEFGIVGALVGGGLDLGFQLFMNGGNLKCVDWGDVGLAMVGGALTGGLVSGAGKIKHGSHSWKQTRKWLGKEGFAQKGQHVHHWLIEKGSKLGKRYPNIVNQPWNLNPMSSPQFHTAVHKLPNGLKQLRGAPGWAQGAAAGGTLAGIDPGGECGCN